MMAHTTGFRDQMNAVADAAVLMKHDYLSQKLIDFVKKYNHELSRFQ